jgi:hypothetical protein
MLKEHQFSVDVRCSMIGGQLTGPSMFERLTDNYLNFSMNKLPLLMEDMPLQTRCRILYQHNEVAPHFVHQVAPFLSRVTKTLDWPSWSNNLAERFLDLTPDDIFLWDQMKEMAYRTKVHIKEDLLHWIMDANAYIREHQKIIQWAVNLSVTSRPVN